MTKYPMGRIVTILFLGLNSCIFLFFFGAFFYELANDYSPDLIVPLAFMAASLPSIIVGFVALAVFDISDRLSNKTDGAEKVYRPQNKKVTEHFNADGSLSHVTVGLLRFSSVDDARKYIEGK